MKTNFLTTAAVAFATISGAAANPASLSMGIEITERDGMTLVREVVCYAAHIHHLPWKAVLLTRSIYSLTNALDCTSDAGSVFILASAAPLATETVIIMSMEAALGVEVAANPSAFLMGKRVRSGVSKRTRLNIHVWSNELGGWCALYPGMMLTGS